MHPVVAKGPEDGTDPGGRYDQGSRAGCVEEGHAKTPERKAHPKQDPAFDGRFSIGTMDTGQVSGDSSSQYRIEGLVIQEFGEVVLV